MRATTFYSGNEQINTNNIHLVSLSFINSGVFLDQPYQISG